MGVEIERKWRLHAVPENLLVGIQGTEFLQGYLCTKPVVRVRREGTQYWLTYKGAGHLQREEYNLPLTEEAFQKLLPKCDGTLIRKRRYRIPLQGKSDASSMKCALVAELDVFQEAFAGLLLMEVEFPDIATAQAFEAPAWFGQEVTENPCFSNSWLSSHTLADISNRKSKEL